MSKRDARYSPRTGDVVTAPIPTPPHPLSNSPTWEVVRAYVDRVQVRSLDMAASLVGAPVSVSVAEWRDWAAAGKVERDPLLDPKPGDVVFQTRPGFRRRLVLSVEAGSVTYRGGDDTTWEENTSVCRYETWRIWCLHGTRVAVHAVEAK